jgi:hypothetical protein
MKLREILTDIHARAYRYSSKGTFTPQIHAYAGRKPADQADFRRKSLRLSRSSRLIRRPRYAQKE